jgi:WD40 repeat protein
LWKELGLKIHLIDGSGEGNSPLPIHKDVAAEFCEICVSVIFKLCFGSGRSASCFSKYIIKDQSESAEELKTAKDPRTSQSASKAVESLKAESIKCIFQVTMRLFTLMLNVLSEQGREKEIAQDICTIVQCCILSSHLSANDISIYREAMQYAKESSEFSAVHKELCQQVYHSLSYGPKDNDAPEQPDLSKLFCAERLYRENAKQQRMLQISTLEKNLEGKSEQIDESRSKYTEEVRTLSQSFSDLDANRRLNASMDSLEAFQQAESDWKSIVRKLRSETGIWASESVQNLRWKLDFTEDFIRRRMKLKRLYSSREYATSSSLSARASESERDRQIISKLPANAIKIGADMDQELPNELQASQEEFAEADDSSPVMPEKKLERSDSIAFSDTAFSAECKLVTVKRVVPGKIHIDRGKLYFSGKAQEHSNLFGKEVPDPSAGKSKRICINVNQIREIHFMRYMLEPSACEIFLEHRGVFLAFESRDEMKRTVKTISMLKPAILVVTGRKKLSLAEIYSSQWRKGEISNFNYLMKLNTLAGRTYNDLSQYPVFPWILADYESEELDLENPEVYRDLSKPVGALDDKRKAVVEERYALSVETDDPARAFHYGSHYSTAGIILYYLIRVEPFTFLHSVLQGGKLDHADRLFNSIGATWNNCNHHSADVKELIPEFFCLPEMFENTNCIDFGTRQDGKVVSQAELPPWAHGSPTEFVKVHRNALESDYVSSHLHSWIDLVFGFKQRGKAAVQAVNVFHYLSYEGNVDISAIEDEFERKVVKDHILHFGQTPSQLFRKKQQARSVKGRKSFWTLQEMKMSLSLARVPSQRSVRYCSILNARIVILDQEAFVHYYKWVTPKAKDMSFTFTASAPADFSIEFDRTSDLLRNQYGSSIGKRHNHFAVLAKSNVLLSIGHWDNSIRCYSLDDFKCCQSVSCHQDAITCVDVGYEEKVVVTGSRDTTVIVWRIIPSASKSGKAAQAVLRDNPMHILYGHQDEVSCVCLSVPLNLVISAGVGGRILFHSLQEGEYVRQFTLSGSSPSKMLAGNTSGLILIYCQRDLKLYTMTVNGGVISSTEIGFRVSSLAWTHEGQHVVIGGEKGTISVRDAYNLQQIKKYDTGTSVNVVVTPEDCLVAACSDGNLFVVKPV